MLAIDVNLLTGRYVAAAFNDRRAPEWPPHPARLFSALVATAAEHEEIAARARRALEWLECQDPPQVLASDAEQRAVVSVYVPGNTVSVIASPVGRQQALNEALARFEAVRPSGDSKKIATARKEVDKASRSLAEFIARAIEDDGRGNESTAARAREMLPEHRGKQPRQFPSVTPETALVRYVWSAAAPDGVTRDALSDLVRRVVRLGHSSSLVACQLVPEGSEATSISGLDTWVPEPEEGDDSIAGSGRRMLRVVDRGQLALLDRAHRRYQQIEPRVLPARHQPYRRRSRAPAVPAARSVFGEWIVLREIAGEGGRRLRLRVSRTEDVTRALRGALLRHVADPAPAVLSGHGPDGGRLESPHVAFLALPDVQSRHASGSILGVAILLPRDIDANDRRAILQGIGRWEQSGQQPRLLLGRAGVMELERVVDENPRRTLDPATWTRASQRWATVTPIALDENPGDLGSRDPETAAKAAECAEAIIARACERIGLPSPEWVQVMRRSLFDASPPARRFMPFPSTGKGLQRVCVHAELRFAEAVWGPVVLGAGRYFGLGVCGVRP